jgi:hypothetical protein
MTRNHEEDAQAGGIFRDGVGQHVVAPDTVQKHVSDVLGKLGAANRTAARRPGARELGLIP